MSNLSYGTIERPYDSKLSRSDLSRIVRSSASPDQSAGDANIESGNDFDNLWIKNWIKSRSYQPKSQGFFLDARNGYIEGMHFVVGGGIEMYGNDMYFYDSTKGVNMTILNPGTGYLPGDVVYINSGSNPLSASIVLDDVNSSDGSVNGFIVSNAGSGYSVSYSVSTTGGSGVGLTLNINSVSPTGAIQVIEDDKATINFQRKFFPDQNFIIQKRVGKDSISETNSDNVFEMYYQNPPQGTSKNKILIGSGGETPTDSSEFTNILQLYATDYIQIGTRTQRSRGISEFIIENNAHDSNINSGGSRFRLTYNQTDPLDYLLFNPDSGERYPWAGGGMLFSSFSSIDDIFPDKSRPAFAFDLGVSDDSGKIWNFSINANGSGYSVGDIITVSGGTTQATLRVLGVTPPTYPIPGEVVDCKLLTHGSGYAIMNSVDTTGGTGTGFKIDILDNKQQGNTWIFSTILPGLCDEFEGWGGITGPSIGSSVYLFKDIYAHRHYFSTTHYLYYNPTDAYFEFAPGGSIKTHGDVLADANIVADFNDDGTGGFIVGSSAGETAVVPIGPLSEFGSAGSLTFKKGILIGHVDPT